MMIKPVIYLLLGLIGLLSCSSIGSLPLGCEIQILGPNSVISSSRQPSQANPALHLDQCVSLHPEYAELSCCSQQVQSIVDQNMEIFDAVFESNAVCLEGIWDFFCGMACSPYQSNYLTVTNSSNSQVLKVNYTLDPNYAQNIFLSCYNVSSFGAPTMGESFQNYSYFFNGIFGDSPYFDLNIIFDNETGYSNILPPVPNPTLNPLPYQLPNFLWSIIEGAEDNFTISQLNLQNFESTYYPIPAQCGVAQAILSVSTSNAVIVCSDEVSVSIVQLDFSLSPHEEFLVFQTMSYQSEGIYIIPGTFAYNENIETLMATGYLQTGDTNITVFTWDFQNQMFDNQGLTEYQEISTDHVASALYDQVNQFYYVSLYDTRFSTGYIFLYNTTSNRDTDREGFELSNVSEYEIQYIVMDGNGQIYGITSDEKNYLMIFTIDYENGQVDLFYHTQNELPEAAGNPVVAFGDYFIILTDPSGSNSGNILSIFDILNQESKNIPITLPENISFCLATF